MLCDLGPGHDLSGPLGFYLSNEATRLYRLQGHAHINGRAKIQQVYGPLGLRVSCFYDPENWKTAVLFRQFTVTRPGSQVLLGKMGATLSHSGSSVVVANHRESLVNPWLLKLGRNGWTPQGHGCPRPFCRLGAEPGHLNCQSAWLQVETPRIERTTLLVAAWTPCPRYPGILMVLAYL